MYTKVGLITEMMDKPPPTSCKIVYAANNVLDKNTGKENTPTQVILIVESSQNGVTRDMWGALGQNFTAYREAD